MCRPLVNRLSGKGRASGVGKPWSLRPFVRVGLFIVAGTVLLTILAVILCFLAFSYAFSIVILPWYIPALRTFVPEEELSWFLVISLCVWSVIFLLLEWRLHWFEKLGRYLADKLLDRREDTMRKG